MMDRRLVSISVLRFHVWIDTESINWSMIPVGLLQLAYCTHANLS